MKDIAEAVGVSNATVSLVLSGNCGTRVSGEVKRKVLEAAERMGYQSNDLARSLRIGKTNLISVIVTDISNDFFGKMSFYIQEEAKKHGYLAITANTNESDSELDTIVSVLLGKKVDGIIAVPTRNGSSSLRKITDKGVPLVQLDRFMEGIESSYVVTDNYKSTEKAVEELIAAGSRKIALVTLNLDVDAIRERKKAYVDVMKKNGLYNEALVKQIKLNDKKASASVLRDIMKCSPDAIFCSSRRTFLSVMENAELSRFISENSVRMLCFDEAKSYKSILNDRLWYIEQPVEEMAKKAFSLLLEKMKGSSENSGTKFRSTLVK